MGDFIVTADTLLSTGISLPSTSQGCNFNKRRKWESSLGPSPGSNSGNTPSCPPWGTKVRAAVCLPTLVFGSPEVGVVGGNGGAANASPVRAQKKAHTASGPDDIRYEMLRQLPPAEQALLLDLYKSVWESHQFPTSCGPSGTVCRGGPLIRMSRREEFIMMRLRIEHSSLTHGFLLKGDPPPMDCVMIRGRRGTLHFVRFPTSEMGNFLVLAKSKGMATLVTTVFATGGGAFKFEDNFQTVFNVLGSMFTTISSPASYSNEFAVHKPNIKHHTIDFGKVEARTKTRPLL
uniref:Uncharacterized protein n=1 Tax=Timema shepardi TaxID=629360 RepID=A0A7R9G4R7_TIMSH|nr:unnamed protein product [Timema shepardi]